VVADKPGLGVAAVALAAVMALGGCDAFTFGGGTVAPVAFVEGASVVVTDKTLGDHLVSMYSGKDCSTIRTSKGMRYCAEDEPAPPPQPYCYRTLGKVTCYDRPDVRRGDRPLGREDPVLGQR
jgi:hypothetical protein